MITELLSGGLFGFLGKAVDKIFPDPAEKAKAQAALMEAQVRGELATLNAEMQVMLAEAQSQDKWTSRARPSFLYVMYTMILSSIPMGIVYAISPETAQHIAEGLRAWLAAIPEAMWTLFGVGFLGYVGGRTYDKRQAFKAAEKVAQQPERGNR